jgi:hypothetical protein
LVYLLVFLFPNSYNVHGKFQFSWRRSVARAGMKRWRKKLLWDDPRENYDAGLKVLRKFTREIAVKKADIQNEVLARISWVWSRTVATATIKLSSKKWTATDWAQGSNQETFAGLIIIISIIFI